MRKIALLVLSLVSGMMLSGGCMSEPSEQLHIDKQVKLSPGHRVMPYKIVLASNGDLIVLGSNDQMDFRAWATRVAPSGEIRWDFLDGGPHGWNDRSVHGQRFFGAIDMPDETTVLCGIKKIERRSTILLVKLDRQGHVLSEKLLPPVRDNVVNSVYGCFKRDDGIVLIGTVSGLPEGTGWMAKLDWDLNLQWKKFNNDFGSGEFINQDGTLTTFSWHSKHMYVVKIGPDGDIIARSELPDGEHHLVLGYRTDSEVRIVTMLPAFKHTELLDFDEQLRGPKRTMKLENVGVKTALALSDGTIAIFGSQYTDSATAAVTRIYKDREYKSFRVEPAHESPWYIDAVLIGKGNEFAAVSQVGVEGAVLDFLSFK